MATLASPCKTGRVPELVPPAGRQKKAPFLYADFLGDCPLGFKPSEIKMGWSAGRQKRAPFFYADFLGDCPVTGH